MIVKIKEEHISKGAPGEGSCCAIALAICEQENLIQGDVYVGRRQVILRGQDGRRVLQLSEEAQKWQRSYDKGGRPGPAELELELVEHQARD